MFRKLLLSLVVTLVPIAASAQVQTMGVACVPGDTAANIINKPLNGAAATRTLTIGPTACGRDLTSYKTMVIETSYSYAAAGAITWTCTQGPSASQAVYAMSTCTTSGGTCTLNWSGVATTPSLSADKQYGVRIDIKGYPVVKCVVSHGGTPGATDFISAFVVLSTL